MARSSRPKADARRGDYQSLDNEIPQEEQQLTPTSTSTSSLTKKFENDIHKSSSTSDRLASRGQPNDADLLSSDDSADDANEDDVRLRPLRSRSRNADENPNLDMRRGPVRLNYNNRTTPLDNTPSGSSSTLLPEGYEGEGSHSNVNEEVSVPKEQRDVGKRIEGFLESERRTLLADSFRTDIEDANTDFVFSDDDGFDFEEEDEYGSPIKTRNEEGEGSRWKRYRHAIFGKKTWWHIGGFFVGAIFLIWIALQGLAWYRSDGQQGYVSVTISILRLLVMVIVMDVVLGLLRC